MIKHCYLCLFSNQVDKALDVIICTLYNKFGIQLLKLNNQIGHYSLMVVKYVSLFLKPMISTKMYINKTIFFAVFKFRLILQLYAKYICCNKL